MVWCKPSIPFNKFSLLRLRLTQDYNLGVPNQKASLTTRVKARVELPSLFTEPILADYA